TGVQEGDVRGVDAALHRLEVVAFLEALRHIAPLGRHVRPFHPRRLGLERGRSHVGPHHAAELDARVRRELDALAHRPALALRGEVDALARDVVFPAVVWAAQPAVLVAPEPERDAAMRAELGEEAQAPFAVAEGDERLAEELD